MANNLSDLANEATARTNLGLGTFATQNAPTGSTQCMHANSAGVVSGTGSDCGSGGGTSPGGASGNVQYDNSGSFGGSTGIALNATQILAFTGVQALINSGSACTVSASGSGGCSGLTNGDCGVTLDVNVSALYTITLPNSVTSTCPITVVQMGTGTVAFAAASGGSLNVPHSLTGETAVQYSTMQAYVIANSGGSAAAWVVMGDIQ